jgi:hypothetical protein
MSDAEKQASEPADEERLDADVEETEGALAAANSNLLREQREVTSVFLLASLIALAFLALFARGRKCRNGALDKQGHLKRSGIPRRERSAKHASKRRSARHFLFHVLAHSSSE